MKNLDEKVARIRLKKRIDKMSKEDIKVNKEEEKTLLDVMNEIIYGEVSINGKVIKFEERSFLNNKISINIPIGYMEEKENTINNVTLINDFYGLSFVANYSEFETKPLSFEEFKKGMIKEFKNNELDMQWIDEGTLRNEKEKIPYGIYKTPTSKGEVFNIIFYKTTNNSLLVGNYNCYYKDKDIFEKVLRASILLIKFN